LPGKQKVNLQSAAKVAAGAAAGLGGALLFPNVPKEFTTFVERVGIPGALALIVILQHGALLREIRDGLTALRTTFDDRFSSLTEAIEDLANRADDNGRVLDEHSRLLSTHNERLAKLEKS
jgi:hypothetical protein